MLLLCLRLLLFLGVSSSEAATAAVVVFDLSEADSSSFPVAASSSESSLSTFCRFPESKWEKKVKPEMCVSIVF